MEFYLRATRAPAKLAILPGAFHPPTRAHLAMAEAALTVADEVVFVLPRAFPHKEYSGAPFETRLAWLRAALGGNPRFSLAASDRGLFIDIAREARTHYSPAPELFVLCGRDRAAPGAIRQWAERAKKMGCPTEKWQEAMDCALAFEEWGRFNEDKVRVPD